MERYGKRIKSTPIFIPDQGAPSLLERVPLTEQLLQEKWLQDMIHCYPSLLPTNEIEPAFSPLVSLGREINAESWSIDNLFISTQGYLTIVETKLWRNPEARREVVGQIIEYAKVVSSWTYNELDQRTRDRNKDEVGRPLGVLDLLRRVVDISESEEGDFIDSVTKNMQRGHFLLLIVGDGIRESTEELASYLSSSPQLHFTLALVELRIFQAEHGYLVIPQIVTRTREIIRAIIHVEGNQIQQISIDTEVRSKNDSPKPKRYTLSEEEFFELLQEKAGSEEVEFAKQLMEDAIDLGLKIEMKQSSYTILHPGPFASDKRLSLLNVYSDGTFRMDFLFGQLEKAGFPRETAYTYGQELKMALKGCEDEKKSNYWKMKPAISKIGEILSAMESFVHFTNETSHSI